MAVRNQNVNQIEAYRSLRSVCGTRNTPLPATGIFVDVWILGIRVERYRMWEELCSSTGCRVFQGASLCKALYYRERWALAWKCKHLESLKSGEVSLGMQRSTKEEICGGRVHTNESSKVEQTDSNCESWNKMICDRYEIRWGLKNSNYETQFLHEGLKWMLWWAHRSELKGIRLKRKKNRNGK